MTDIAEHGRLPSALEVDTCEYLPSSRHIQRIFGGLVHAREKLGYKDLHFGAGEFRSLIAKEAVRQGLLSEYEIEKILVSKFGEPFVHVERKIGNSRNRVDFYVYHTKGCFAVDVFHTSSFFSLKSNVNLKLRKNLELACPMIYLLPDDSISQPQIDSWTKVKTKPLAENQFIYSLSSFMSYINDLQSYPNPLL